MVNLDYKSYPTFPFEFIVDNLIVVADSNLTDKNTQIILTNANKIETGVSIGEVIRRCCSEVENEVRLKWRITSTGASFLDDSKHELVILRRKRCFSMSYDHSNGPWAKVLKDPSAEEVYRSNDWTVCHYEDTTNLEPGVEYCYTMFIRDNDQDSTISNALETNNKAQINVVNRKERICSTWMFNNLPFNFYAQDVDGSTAAWFDTLGSVLDRNENIINLLNYENHKTLYSKAVKIRAGDYGMGEAETALGIDTMRRQMRYCQDVFRYSGCRRGIIKFIRMLTTWQIGISNIYLHSDTTPDYFHTYGSSPETPLWDEYTGYGYGLFSTSEDINIGTITEQKIVVEIPRVALAIGNSTDISWDTTNEYATIEDTAVDFTLTNPNEQVLLPNQNNPEYRHRIFDSDSTHLYCNDRVVAAVGEEYVVLTQLDAARLDRLVYWLIEKSMMIPFFNRIVIKFTV